MPIAIQLPSLPEGDLRFAAALRYRVLKEFTPIGVRANGSGMRSLPQECLTVRHFLKLQTELRELEARKETI